MKAEISVTAPANNPLHPSALPQFSEVLVQIQALPTTFGALVKICQAREMSCRRWRPRQSSICQRSLERRTAVIS